MNIIPHCAIGLGKFSLLVSLAEIHYDSTGYFRISFPTYLRIYPEGVDLSILGLRITINKRNNTNVSWLYGY